MPSKPQFVGERKIVTLGDSSTLVMGQSPASDSYNQDGEGLPFYQGNADFGRKNPTPRIWCTDPKKIAEKGDILISVRAPIGAVNTASERCCIGRGVAAIRPNQQLLTTSFLKHQLLASSKKLEAMGTGSTFKAVGKKALTSFPISLYPTITQAVIEQQLDWTLNELEVAKHQLTSLGTLVKSRFVEMFGNPALNPMKWDVGTIESCCVNLDSQRVPITQGSRIDGPYPYIGASGVVDHVANFIFDETLLLISEDGANLLARTSPIAFTISGKSWVNNHAHVLRCRDDETRVYLQVLINMLDISSYVSGSAQPKLSQKQMNRIPIMLPNRKLLVEFADFASQVDKSRFVAQQQIEKLQMLYDSLAQEYFGD